MLDLIECMPRIPLMCKFYQMFAIERLSFEFLIGKNIWHLDSV